METLRDYWSVFHVLFVNYGIWMFEGVADTF